MHERLGIIGGSGFLSGHPLREAVETKVETERGEVTFLFGEGFAFLLRHGHGCYRPPHRIPHHAHALAFEAIGVRQVVGFNSVGALATDLLPGTVVVADDYVSVHPPPSFVTEERLHVVPTLSEALRSILIEAARETVGPLRERGTYVETTGPRFETRAEVRIFRDWGDIIGMTAASEATLLQEREIAYAMLGIVDNYANGIGPDALTFEAYEAQLAANGERGRRILESIVRGCAREGGLL